MKTRLSSLFAIATILMNQTAAYAQTTAGRGPDRPAGNGTAPRIVMSTTRDPQTGVLYEMSIEQTPWEKLKESSPENLRRDGVLGKILSAGQAAGRGGKAVGRAGGEIIKAFPAEFSTFTAAMGLIAVRKMLFESDMHPESIRNFIAHAVTDPMAYLSFVTFMAANRGTSAAFSAVGVKYGFMRDEKSFHKLITTIAGSNPTGITIEQAVARANTMMPAPASDKALQILKGHIAMASALFLSGVFVEFMNDPDIKNCVNGWFISPDQMATHIAKVGKSPTASCNDAYSAWLSTGKLMQYLPDITSVAMTTVVMSSIVTPVGGVLRQAVTRGAERVIPLLFRGLVIARVGAMIVPQLRVASIILNIWVFLELNEIFLSPIQNVIYRARNTGRILALQKTLPIANARPKLPEPCLKIANEHLKPEVVKGMLYSQLAMWLHQNAENCGVIPPSPIELIKEYDRMMTDWRAHWFRHVNTALGEWSTYVSGFQDQYQSSKQFYHMFVQQMADPTSPLFQSAPYRGIGGPDATSDQMSQVISDAILFARGKIAELKAKKKSYLELEALEVLTDVEASLSALDSQAPPTATLTAALKNIPTSDVEGQMRARDAEFALGIIRLKKIYEGHPYFPYVDPANDPYGVSTLYEKLKSADPQGPGWAYIQDVNEDPSIIVGKNTFITNWDRAAFRNKAESMVGLFVCGPETAEVRDNFITGLQFIPPKMVQTGNFNFCARPPRNTEPNKTYFSPRLGIWKLEDGRVLNGFIDVAKTFVDPSLRGASGIVSLDDRWKATVEPVARAKALKIKEQFDQMIVDKAIPALTDARSYDETIVAGRGAVKSTGNKIPYGVIPSLEYQMKVLLNLMQKYSGDTRGQAELEAVNREFARMSEILKVGPSKEAEMILTAEERKLADGYLEALYEKQTHDARFGVALQLLSSAFEEKVGLYLAALREVTVVDDIEIRLVLVDKVLKTAGEISEYSRAYMVGHMSELN